MASILLNLNTADVSSKISSSNCRFYFDNPISLGNLNWTVCLKQLFSWYSFYNCVGQSIQYSYDSGSNWITVNLPDGIYGIEDIDLALHAEMEAQGHYDSVNNLYYISLYANYSIGKVYTEITNATYRLRITANDMPTILGITAGDYSASFYGQAIADVNNGIDSLNVSCSIVDGSYNNGRASNIIYSYTPSGLAYSNIIEQPYNLTKLQVNTSTITSINMVITDQNGNIVDLNGEDTQYILVLEPFK